MLLPDLLQVSVSINCHTLQYAGIRLLEKMGWRQGKGIGPAKAASQQTGGSRWGPEAGVGAENTAIHLLEPKQDTHGLGFDPFKV